MWKKNTRRTIFEWARKRFRWRGPGGANPHHEIVSSLTQKSSVCVPNQKSIKQIAWHDRIWHKIVRDKIEKYYSEMFYDYLDWPWTWPRSALLGRNKKSYTADDDLSKGCLITRTRKFSRSCKYFFVDCNVKADKTTFGGSGGRIHPALQFDKLSCSHTKSWCLLLTTLGLEFLPFVSKIVFTRYVITCDSPSPSVLQSITLTCKIEFRNKS